MRHQRRGGLHRSALLVLAFGLLATLFSTVIAQRLVQQSEQRLLEQKAGAAAIVMSSLMSQSYGAGLQALAASAPGGVPEPQRFAATAAALTAEPTAAAPQTLGATGVAVLDLRTGRVLASQGSLVVDPLKDRSALATAGRVALEDPGHLAYAGRWRSGARTALGMIAPVTSDIAVYLETPVGLTVDASLVDASPLLSQAFGGLDFTVSYGPRGQGAILWSSRQSGELSGKTAAAYVGASAGSGFEDSTYDPDRRPVEITLSSRSPLTGRFAELFPWLLLGVGVISCAAVVALTEATQRRSAQALSLVDELEQRNADVEAAVTRQEQAEEQLRQSQRLEALGQLAGGIAHDFNNLLAVIFSYAGFLKQSTAGTPQAEDVEEIDRAAHRAAELTQQLLLFSRREERRATVVDLRAVVADRFRLLRRTLSEDIVVEVNLPDEPVLVAADELELDQVIMNLVVNARDALPAGGTIEVTLTAALSPEGQASLVVADTGVGMPAEVLARAFEPFFTTKEVGRGTGLGLATVYGIAVRWGGTTSIESTPGQGTRVTVLLPPATGPLVSRTPLPTSVPNPPTGATVLLVEDDPSVRRANERILSDAGFVVRT
ncbi:MAG: ATP-binding protein, partial [Mycobacteriales bacterium]